MPESATQPNTAGTTPKRSNGNQAGGSGLNLASLDGASRATVNTSRAAIRRQGSDGARTLFIAAPTMAHHAHHDARHRSGNRM
jgi:hypothetical protein